MPPLLPEYLSQPLGVSIQALPPTDWWPIWFAAIATLLGSFGGAWVGGRYAYKSTVKANAELLKRQRLEEALTIVNDMRDKIVRLRPVIENCNDVEIDAKKVDSLHRHAAELDGLQLPRLKALFLLSDSQLRTQVVMLEADLVLLKASMSVLGGDILFTGTYKKEADKHLESVRDRLISLISTLVKELKL